MALQPMTRTQGGLLVPSGVGRIRQAASGAGVAADVAVAALGSEANTRLCRYLQEYCWSDTGSTVQVVANDKILRTTRLDQGGGNIASSGTDNPRWDATEDAAEFNVGFTVTRGFNGAVNIITGGQPWSMCVRTRNTSLLVNRCLFGASQTTISNGGVHFYAVPSNAWTLEVFAGGGASYLSLSSVQPSDGWATLCVSFDGTNYVIDANGGAERVSSTMAGRDPNTGTSMYLGSRIQSGVNWRDDYVGYVGAHLFTDYAVSAAQCASLHAYWSGIWN